MTDQLSARELARQLLSEILGADAGPHTSDRISISDERTLVELGVDSLKIVTLLARLDESFPLSFERVSEIPPPVTAGDLLSFCDVLLVDQTST